MVSMITTNGMFDFYYVDGKWVISSLWLQHCIDNETILSEDSYEVSIQ